MPFFDSNSNTNTITSPSPQTQSFLKPGLDRQGNFTKGLQGKSRRRDRASRHLQPPHVECDPAELSDVFLRPGFLNKDPENPLGFLGVLARPGFPNRIIRYVRYRKVKYIANDKLRRKGTDTSYNFRWYDSSW